VISDHLVSVSSSTLYLLNRMRTCYHFHFSDSSPCDQRRLQCHYFARHLVEDSRMVLLWERDTRKSFSKPRLGFEIGVFPSCQDKSISMSLRHFTNDLLKGRSRWPIRIVRSFSPSRGFDSPGFVVHSSTDPCECLVIHLALKIQYNTRRISAVIPHRGSDL
jgi:hypothetical protein